jgi:hypothetical protein
MVVLFEINEYGVGGTLMVLKSYGCVIHSCACHSWGATILLAHSAHLPFASTKLLRKCFLNLFLPPGVRGCPAKVQAGVRGKPTTLSPVP